MEEQHYHEQQQHHQFTDLSPFSYICCSKCRRDFINSQNPDDFFYLTSCSHHICATCFEPPGPRASESEHLVLKCPVCSTRGKIVWLEVGLKAVGMEGLRHCFRPMPDLIDDLRQSFEYQFGNILDQLVFYKDKVAKQQQVLTRLSGEFKNIKDLRSHASRLESENASLRAALDVANGSNNGLDTIYEDSRPRKRKTSPGRSSSNGASRQAPQNAVISERSSIPTNLPLQPNRISLSPAHTQLHSSRSYQANLQRTDADSNEKSLQMERSNSRIAKDRLHDFAYNPSRDQRPTSRPQSVASITHRPFQPPPRTDSYSEQHRPQSRQNDPYTRSPPPTPGSNVFDYPVESHAHYHAMNPPQRSVGSSTSQRAPFVPPSRGVTPMPVPSRNVPQFYNQPPPSSTITAQRQSFQRPQFRSEANSAGNSRPSSRSAFLYRDPEQAYQEATFGRFSNSNAKGGTVGRPASQLR